MRNISNILIIRFSSMGDIILASPLIRILRKKYPDARIDVLTKEQYGDLVRFNPHISSVVTLKTNEKKELNELAPSLREKHYDVLLDLHNSIRSRYIRSQINPGELHIVNKRVVPRFFLVNLKWNFYKETIPVAERYLETAASLGIEDDNKGLELFLPDQAKVTAGTVLKDFFNGADCVIGMAPTAKHFTKIWPAERFIELARRAVNEFHAKLLIFGGKEDEGYCNEISAKINAGGMNRDSFNCAGKFTILETAAAMDRCEIVVTNDTGLMHLASARGRKIVALFGSTVKEFGFFPFRSDSIVIENTELRCRPCTHIGRDHCPKGHFKCMTELSVDNVLGAVRSLLTIGSDAKQVRNS